MPPGKHEATPPHQASVSPSVQGKRCLRSLPRSWAPCLLASHLQLSVPRAWQGAVTQQQDAEGSPLPRPAHTKGILLPQPASGRAGEVRGQEGACVSRTGVGGQPCRAAQLGLLASATRPAQSGTRCSQLGGRWERLPPPLASVRYRVCEVPCLMFKPRCE